MRTLTLTCMLMLFVAAAFAAQATASRIELPAFQKLHAAKKVLVVDVRDDQSFASGHIPGAINIPLGEEERAAHAATLKAEKRPIVTYCA